MTVASDTGLLLNKKTLKHVNILKGFFTAAISGCSAGAE